MDDKHEWKEVRDGAFEMVFSTFTIHLTRGFSAHFGDPCWKVETTGRLVVSEELPSPIGDPEKAKADALAAAEHAAWGLRRVTTAAKAEGDK